MAAARAGPRDRGRSTRRGGLRRRSRLEVAARRRRRGRPRDVAGRSSLSERDRRPALRLGQGRTLEPVQGQLASNECGPARRRRPGPRDYRDAPRARRRGVETPEHAAYRHDHRRGQRPCREAAQDRRRPLTNRSDPATGRNAGHVERSDHRGRRRRRRDPVDDRRADPEDPRGARGIPGLARTGARGPETDGSFSRSARAARSGARSHARWELRGGEPEARGRGPEGPGFLHRAGAPRGDVPEARRVGQGKGRGEEGRRESGHGLALRSGAHSGDRRPDRRRSGGGREGLSEPLRDHAVGCRGVLRSCAGSSPAGQFQRCAGGVPARSRARPEIREGSRRDRQGALPVRQRRRSHTRAEHGGHALRGNRQRPWEGIGPQRTGNHLHGPGAVRGGADPFPAVLEHQARRRRSDRRSEGSHQHRNDARGGRVASTNRSRRDRRRSRSHARWATVRPSRTCCRSSGTTTTWRPSRRLRCGRTRRASRSSARRE